MPRLASAFKAAKTRKPGGQDDALLLPTGDSHAMVMAEQTEMPEGWKCVRLGELLREVDVRQTDLPKTAANALEVLSLTKNDGLILQSVRFGKRIATDDTSKYKVVREGQIVYNPYVIWEGAVHALRKHRAGLVSPVYPVWETLEPDGGFVDYLLRTPPLIDAYNRVCSGAVNRRRSIREEGFTAIKVTVPPLREQRAIAEVLRTVQQAKEATAKVIAATRQLKASLMKHLFTYGPVPFDQADHVPPEETDVGPIPENWQVTCLEGIKAPQKGAIVSGPFGSNIGKRFFVPSGVPLIRGCNLTAGQALFVEEGFVFITEEKALELANCTALPDDLVFTAAGTIGQVGLIPQNCRYPKYVISNKQLRARVDKSKANPLFLFYWFTQPRMQAYVQARKSGTSIPVINLSVLRALPIGLPSMSEQRQIAEQLSAVDANLATKEQRREALDGLFKSLLYHLMMGKVRLPEFAEAS